MSQNPTTTASTHQPRPKRENFTPEQVEHWRSKLMGKEVSENGKSMALHGLEGFKRSWEFLITLDPPSEEITVDEMRANLDEASRKLAAKEQQGLSADCIDVTELPLCVQVVPQGGAVLCIDYRLDRIRAYLDLDGRVCEVIQG